LKNAALDLRLPGGDEKAQRTGKRLQQANAAIACLGEKGASTDSAELVA
jgi:hypothetical protein